MHRGQEIYLFFYQFGYKGWIGIFISSFLMGGIIFLSFRLMKKYEIEDYYHFLEKINGNNSKLKLNKIIGSIINLFLLISFYIMIAGFSAYLSQEFRVPFIIGSLIITFLCYLTFQNNIEGMIKVNTILIPILIIFIIVFGMKSTSILSDIKPLEISGKGNWLLSAILYGSYNSILLIPILITLKKYIKGNKQSLIISTICVSIIILLATSIYNILTKINIEISKIELPVIYVISFMGKGYKIVYGLVMISSIFTTAVSSGYSFLANCSKSKRGYQYLNLFICISGILISNIGFSNLIIFLYPTFGVLGFIQIFLIIKSNYQLTIEKKR